MPPYSSYKLELFDISYFKLLKQTYGRLIKDLIRTYINYVSKLEFLYAFREAFFASITKKNIQGSFIGASLIPYNLERVLSKLDIELRTPTPLTLRPSTAQP
jgi:hypothetical protein